MELQEFVANAINQVVEAVNSANSKVNAKGASVNPCYENNSEPLNEPIMMEFDLAITVRDDAAVTGRAKLNVVGLGIGGDASKSASENIVSHVKFTVPVQLPVGKKVGFFEPPSGARSRSRSATENAG